MRLRQLIEDSMKDMVVPAGQSSTYKTFLEMLLDIRELLQRQDERAMRQEVLRSRKIEEMRRLREVMDNRKE